MTCQGNTYPFGSLIAISVVFVNVKTGVNQDPTDVILKLQHGSDPVQTFTYSGGQVLRSGVGAYYYNFQPMLAGDWTYSWEGTGAVIGSTQNIPFNVTSNLFGP